MIPMTHDYVTMIVLPQTVRLTLGVLTVVVIKGLVRSEFAHRIRGNSRSFVLAFSFDVWACVYTYRLYKSLSCTQSRLLKQTLLWVDFSWSPEQNLSSLGTIHS